MEASAHAHGTVDSERRVLLALGLTLGFMGVEVAGGLLSGSLALLADAGHMLTDAASLGAAYLGFRLGRRPADARRSYGYRRFEVLAAWANSIGLFFIFGWIVVEAIHRWMQPLSVQGGIMLAVAVVGLAVNAAAFAILHAGDQGSLNIRGAALHVLGDLLGSIAVIGAAGMILVTGWNPIDPILSVFVALLILLSAWRLAREATHVLLEGVPAGLDPEKIRASILEAVPFAEDVHHVHAWSLTEKIPLLTLHVQVCDLKDSDAVLHRVKDLLRERFGVVHSTVQIAMCECPDREGERACILEQPRGGMD